MRMGIASRGVGILLLSGALTAADPLALNRALPRRGPGASASARRTAAASAVPATSCRRGPVSPRWRGHTGGPLSPAAVQTMDDTTPLPVPTELLRVEPGG